ncbi:hypothetical protein OG589_29925 [Sphaerisporangium sp. NBC_01403]|uniref:hypothetical protein n=1 Tax=Sphaerisporangium sp. NBC_01403 TaxID=2903599 RepID=UPI00324773B5
MPRTPRDWADLEQELHEAGVSPSVIEEGIRKLLADARGHQLAEASNLDTDRRTSPAPWV